MAIERPEQMLGNFIADALAHAASPQRLEGSITRHSGAVPVAGHLSNSITSARPPWQRIRPGTRRTPAGWRYAPIAVCARYVVSRGGESLALARPANKHSAARIVWCVR